MRTVLYLIASVLVLSIVVVFLFISLTIGIASVPSENEVYLITGLMSGLFVINVIRNRQVEP